MDGWKGGGPADWEGYWPAARADIHCGPSAAGAAVQGAQFRHPSIEPRPGRRSSLKTRRSLCPAGSARRGRRSSTAASLADPYAIPTLTVRHHRLRRGLVVWKRQASSGWTSSRCRHVPATAHYHCLYLPPLARPTCAQHEVESPRSIHRRRSSSPPSSTKHCPACASRLDDHGSRRCLVGGPPARLTGARSDELP